MENVEACINCGSRDLRHWLLGRDRLLSVTDQRFAYAWCGKCGVALERTRPRECEIAKFYPEAYGPFQATQPRAPRTPAAEQRNQKLLEFARHTLAGAAFTARVTEFYDRMRPGAVFLDFGCGSGHFLNKARQLGCETIGMDFSPQALAEVERKHHRALPVSDAGWARIADGSVDIVRMNHVVEHLYAPQATLARLFDKMRPGAGLHIATPNPRGLSARIFGARWHGLDCPRHVVLYTPEALTRLLRGIGFVKNKVLHEPITKDMVRSFGYVLADLGLKRRETVDAMIDNGPLNLLFAVPGRLAWHRGMADRFHVLAEKPA